MPGHLSGMSRVRLLKIANTSRSIRLFPIWDRFRLPFWSHFGSIFRHFSVSFLGIDFASFLGGFWDGFWIMFDDFLSKFHSAPKPHEPRFLMTLTTFWHDSQGSSSSIFSCVFENSPSFFALIFALLFWSFFERFWSHFGFILAPFPVILASFYLTFASIDFALIFHRFLIDFWYPRHPFLLIKQIENRVFWKNTFSENALILLPFLVHFFMILDPFWHHFLDFFGIDFCIDFWKDVASILESFWLHFGSVLAPLAQFWVNFGTIFGIRNRPWRSDRFWEPFWWIFKGLAPFWLIFDWFLMEF